MDSFLTTIGAWSHSVDITKVPPCSFQLRMIDGGHIFTQYCIQTFQSRTSQHFSGQVKVTALIAGNTQLLVTSGAAFSGVNDHRERLGYTIAYYLHPQYVIISRLGVVYSLHQPIKETFIPSFIICR